MFDELDIETEILRMESEGGPAHANDQGHANEIAGEAKATRTKSSDQGQEPNTCSH